MYSYDPNLIVDHFILVFCTAEYIFFVELFFGIFTFCNFVASFLVSNFCLSSMFQKNLLFAIFLAFCVISLVETISYLSLFSFSSSWQEEWENYKNEPKLRKVTKSIRQHSRQNR